MTKKVGTPTKLEELRNAIKVAEARFGRSTVVEVAKVKGIEYTGVDSMTEQQLQTILAGVYGGK